MGKTTPLNDEDLKDFVQLQKTKADSLKSWSVDAGALAASATCDLSVKNPNRAEEKVLREPHEIIAEIQKLDAETAGILQKIRELV